MDKTAVFSLPMSVVVKRLRLQLAQPSN